MNWREIIDIEQPIHTDHCEHIELKRLLSGKIQYCIYPIEPTAHLMGRNSKRPFKFEELQAIEEPEKIEYPLDEFMRSLDLFICPCV